MFRLIKCAYVTSSQFSRQLAVVGLHAAPRVMCPLAWTTDGCIKPISQLRFDYHTTTIRRCHDAFDYDGSDRNYDLRSIRLRYDYDTTTTKN